MQFVSTESAAIVAYAAIADMLALAPPQLWAAAAHVYPKNAKRQHEWIAARQLLATMLGQQSPPELYYDQHGKPHLSSATHHIGISHSSQWVAVVCHATQAVGIDIEPITARVAKVSSKFLSATELAVLLVPPNKPPDLAMLTLCWCAKETAYKWYGQRQVNFAAHLHLQLPCLLPTPSTQTVELRFVLPHRHIEQSLAIHYLLLPHQLVLTWVVQ